MYGYALNPWAAHARRSAAQRNAGATPSARTARATADQAAEASKQAILYPQGVPAGLETGQNVGAARSSMPLVVIAGVAVAALLFAGKGKKVL